MRKHREIYAEKREQENLKYILSIFILFLNFKHFLFILVFYINTLYYVWSQLNLPSEPIKRIC